MTAHLFSNKAFSNILMSGFTLLLFSGSSCAPKRSKMSPVTTLAQSKAGPSTSTKNSETVVPKNGPSFFLVEQNRPPVDPQMLNIFRLTVAKMQLGNSIVPLISFGIDGLADFVRWEICPISEDLPCIKGTSAVSEVIPGHISSGKYSVSVRVCVHKNRSLNPDDQCGLPEQKTYEHPVSEKNQIQDIIQDLKNYEYQLKEYGPRLEQVLRDFKRDLSSCKLLKNNTKGKFIDQAEEETIREIEIQMENILNLGQEFIGESLAYVRMNQTDDQLASILVEDTPVNQSDQGSAYNPGGLSLANASNEINDFYQDQVYRWSSGGLRIPDLDVSQAILGSSGLMNDTNIKNDKLMLSDTPLQTTELKSRLQNMDARQRSSTFAGLLTMENQLGLATSGSYTKYAEGELTRSMLFLSKPKNLPSCAAWDRVDTSLVAIRRGIRILREQLQLARDQLDKIERH